MKKLQVTINGVAGTLFLKPYLWVGYTECGPEFGGVLMVTHPALRECCFFSRS